METVEEAFIQLRPFVGPSGTCDDQETFDEINKARKLLWNKTDYPETMDYFCIHCAPDCFFMPSAYKQIRLAWLNNRPISIGDEWYISVPQTYAGEAAGSCHQNLKQIGGFYVTFQNYTDSPYQIAVQAEDPRDNGIEITTFGVDLYGTSRKETLALAVPPQKSLSKNFYTSLATVIKPRTAGRVRVYAVDPMNGKYLLLAVYQPYDKNPQFRKYSVPKTYGDRQLTIYAKRSYFDLVSSNELIEFPIEAMKFAMMALACQKDKDNERYLQNLQLAVQELNLEIADNEIPTAAPMRFFHTDQPEHLIRY